MFVQVSIFLLSMTMILEISFIDSLKNSVKENRKLRIFLWLYSTHSMYMYENEKRHL